MGVFGGKEGVNGSIPVEGDGGGNNESVALNKESQSGVSVKKTEYNPNSSVSGK